MIKMSIYKILEFVIFLILLILAGIMSDIPDFESYQNIYMQIYKSHDFLFDIISGFFYEIGLPFVWFRFFWLLIGMLLIRHTMKKYLGPRWQVLFWICFLLFPYFIEIIQMRNFMVMCILTYSLPFLWTGGMKNTNKCAILIFFWLVVYIK